MTAIHLGETVPALDNPEPSATKLGRAWGEGIDWQAVEDSISDQPEPTLAPVERATLDRRIVDAHAPRWVTGSFRVPYGMRQHQLEALCKEMLTRWVDHMALKGFDAVSGSDIRLAPGPNPSKDLATGLEIPGHRDYLLSLQFVERHPETIRLEVPGGLFDPLTLTQRATSSGDEGD